MDITGMQPNGKGEWPKYGVLTASRPRPTLPWATLPQPQGREPMRAAFFNYAQNYRISRPIAGLQRSRSGQGLQSAMLAEVRQPPTVSPRRHEQAQTQACPFQSRRRPLLAPEPPPHSTSESARFHAAQPPQSGVNAQRLGPVLRSMLAQNPDNKHSAHAARHKRQPGHPVRHWTRQEVLVLSREWWAGRHRKDILRAMKKVNESYSEKATDGRQRRMRIFPPALDPDPVLCRLPYLKYTYEGQ